MDPRLKKMLMEEHRAKSQIGLPFNKDSMSVRDLKAAATTLQGILLDFDKFSDDPEEFASRVLQIRGAYNPNA